MSIIYLSLTCSLVFYWTYLFSTILKYHLLVSVSNDVHDTDLLKSKLKVDGYIIETF